MRLKVNWTVSLVTLILLLTGCNNAMNKNTTKFEWDATESAPLHYPMKIIQGTFIYHGEAEEGLYVPSGGTISSGWGEPISSHLVGEKYKPLPDRLKIAYFSFAEKQFYQGEFALPYEQMLALFREGVANAVTFDGRDMPEYSRIMVGVAPGGTVAVWVTGRKTVEVFFGQAQKVDLDPGSAFDVPFDSEEDADTYIREVLEEELTPAELQSLKKHGIPFGVWARYRNRYDWLPTFSGGHYPTDADVIYLNGENITNWNSTDKKELNIQRPVPQEVRFMGEQALYTVTFDDIETMAAFEKLGANGKKVFLEFEPRMPRTNIRIRLYNDKESIELKKFVSKK